MKKIFFSIFLLLYAVSNVGATVQLHLCCGDVVNWSLKEISPDSSRHSSCCGEQQPQEEDECCIDKDINIKLEQPQLLSTIDYLFNSHFSHTENNFYIDYSRFLEPCSEAVSYHSFPQPPPSKAENIGLFILYKNLKLAC